MQLPLCNCLYANCPRATAFMHRCNGHPASSRSPSLEVPKLAKQGMRLRSLTISSSDQIRNDLPTTTPYALQPEPLAPTNRRAFCRGDWLARLRAYLARLAFLRLPFTYISAFMPIKVSLSRVGPMKWYSRYPGYVVPKVLCTASARRQSYKPSI